MKGLYELHPQDKFYCFIKRRLVWELPGAKHMFCLRPTEAKITCGCTAATCSQWQYCFYGPQVAPSSRRALIRAHGPDVKSCEKHIPRQTAPHGHPQICNRAGSSHALTDGAPLRTAPRAFLLRVK